MTDQSDREVLARGIYDALPFDGKHPSGQKPAWVPGGNSIMQDHARREADRILALGFSRHQWQPIESAPKGGRK